MTRLVGVLIPEAAGQEAAIRILSTIPLIIGIETENELIQLLKKEESVLENLVVAIAWTAKKKALEQL